MICSRRRLEEYCGAQLPHRKPTLSLTCPGELDFAIVLSKREIQAFHWTKEKKSGTISVPGVPGEILKEEKEPFMFHFGNSELAASREARAD